MTCTGKSIKIGQFFFFWKRINFSTKSYKCFAKIVLIW